jgi:hypothetical protein
MAIEVGPSCLRTRHGCVLALRTVAFIANLGHSISAQDIFAQLLPVAHTNMV